MCVPFVVEIIKDVMSALFYPLTCICSAYVQLEMALPKGNILHMLHKFLPLEKHNGTLNVILMNFP